MKTYLQLVNNVLKALREDQTTDVNADAYIELVGKFVNDAKQQVEDSWDWSAYNEVRTSTIAGGADFFVLAGTDNRVKLEMVSITDPTAGTNSLLVEIPRKVILLRSFTSTEGAAGIPTNYANNGVDANGDALISVSPPALTASNVMVSGWFRPTDLVSNADTLSIPYAPVQDLAVAMAVREGGESAGQTSAEYFEIAKRSLSDAIAYDSARNGEETDWHVDYTPYGRL
jgi:hypothetical protein